MHRNYLLQLLEEYKPLYQEEIVAKEKIISFVKKYSDCFERTLEVGHITASAWLLNKQATHALLTHHAKLNLWLQLGGHCDGNSNVLEVALKEAQEESGIIAIQPVSSAIFDIDVHLIPANSKEKAHYHYDVRFLLQVKSNENIITSNESKELRWIEKDIMQLPTKELSVQRMFTKWIAFPSTISDQDLLHHP